MITTGPAVGRADAVPRPALWCLTAGLLLAAAVAGLGGLVYAESGTNCESLLSRAAQRARQTVEDCEPYWNARVSLVGLLTLLSIASGARAGLLAARGRRGGPADAAERPSAAPRRPSSVSLPMLAWAIPVSAALAAVAYFPVFVLGLALVGGYEGFFDSPAGLPGGWLHLTYAVGGTAAHPLLRQAGLTARSTLAAVTVAVPLTVLSNAVLTAVLAPPESRLPDLEARGATMATAWLLFAVVLLVMARAQVVGRGTPRPAHSVAVLLLGLWLVTPVLVVSYRPDYDPFGGGWENGHLGPTTWVPLLAAPAIASALLLARAARRRSSTTQP